MTRRQSVRALASLRLLNAGCVSLFHYLTPRKVKIEPWGTFDRLAITTLHAMFDNPFFSRTSILDNGPMDGGTYINVPLMYS